MFAKGCLTDSDLKSRLQQNAFFEYAAQNWAYHIQDTQQSVGDLALKLLMDDGKASASSQVLFPYHFPQQFCGMHLVAYFGLNDIMVRLLEEKDPRYQGQLWPDATVLRRGKGERAGGRAAS